MFNQGYYEESEKSSLSPPPSSIYLSSQPVCLCMVKFSMPGRSRVEMSGVRLQAGQAGSRQPSSMVQPLTFRETGDTLVPGEINSFSTAAFCSRKPGGLEARWVREGTESLFMHISLRSRCWVFLLSLHSPSYLSPAGPTFHLPWQLCSWRMRLRGSKLLRRMAGSMICCTAITDTCISRCVFQ